MPIKKTLTSLENNIYVDITSLFRSLGHGYVPKSNSYEYETGLDALFKAQRFFSLMTGIPLSREVYEVTTNSLSDKINIKQPHSITKLSYYDNKDTLVDYDIDTNPIKIEIMNDSFTIISPPTLTVSSNYTNPYIITLQREADVSHKIKSANWVFSDTEQNGFVQKNSGFTYKDESSGGLRKLRYYIEDNKGGIKPFKSAELNYNKQITDTDLLIGSSIIVSFTNFHTLVQHCDVRLRLTRLDGSVINLTNTNIASKEDTIASTVFQVEEMVDGYTDIQIKIKPSTSEKQTYIALTSIESKSLSKSERYKLIDIAIEECLIYLSQRYYNEQKLIYNDPDINNKINNFKL